MDDSHLNTFYNLCDVFIMASRAIMERPAVEGFGIVYLEANACGKPVIGGRVGGVPDAILEGETGILIDPENPDEISDALIKLLTDERLSKRLGENGRHRVINNLNWETVAARTIDTIKDLLNAKIDGI